ncbi:MAG: colicin E5-related ribonuclease, partial [Clostridia bacterium]|nr:colicin E5-related ribonuclease [Clostridia bacterium]
QMGSMVNTLVGAVFGVGVGAAVFKAIRKVAPKFVKSISKLAKMVDKDKLLKKLPGGMGKAIQINITGKIQGQMTKRGWTKKSITKTIEKPFTTREALNKATGNKATAYYTSDGYYVVKDNITGDVVQISKVGDANWVPDSTIVNPYNPNK